MLFDEFDKRLSLVTATTGKVEHFHYLSRFPRAPLPSTSSHIRDRRHYCSAFHHSSFAFLDFHINGIQHCSLLCLLLLTITFLNSLTQLHISVVFQWTSMSHFVYPLTNCFRCSLWGSHHKESCWKKNSGSGESLLLTYLFISVGYACNSGIARVYRSVLRNDHTIFRSGCIIFAFPPVM